MLARSQHEAPKCHLARGRDCLPDRDEGIGPDLAFRGDEVGADVVEVVNLLARHELVDVDGAGRFYRDRLKVLIGDLDVVALRDLIALNDVLAVHLITRLCIYLHVTDAVAGVLVELIEADLLALARGGEKRDRAGDERKTKVALPVRARGHDAYS